MGGGRGGGRGGRERERILGNEYPEEWFTEEGGSLSMLLEEKLEIPDGESRRWSWPLQQ